MATGRKDDAGGNGEREPAQGEAPGATGTDHWEETLRDGTRILIRHLTIADAGLEREFIERLSPESRAYRFLGHVSVTDELIRRLTNVDQKRDVAFVALRLEQHREREIGVARFSASADGAECECAVTVSDEWQGKGVGYTLMRHLIEVARARGIKRMFSIDRTDNVKMRELATGLGFTRTSEPGAPGEVIHTLLL